MIYKQSQTINGVEVITDPRPLEDAKAQARNRINLAYERDLADGVEVGGLTLGTTPEDQQQFGHGLTLVNTALIAQMATPQTLVSALFGRTVSAIDGTQHDMTIQQYIGLAIAYAQAIGAIQARRNAKLAAIEATETNEAADAVEWS